MKSPVLSIKFKNKIILFFCTFYVITHLAVAFLSIRSWPFTDYPMFAYPDYKEAKIIIYEYFVLFTDGREVPLRRAFTRGFGSNDWNISALVKNRDLISLKKVFSYWLKHKENGDRIKEIIIKKVTVTRPLSRKDELKMDTKTVFKIPKEDLI